MSDTMQWIADHILWLLGGAWIVAALLLVLSVRAIWRWFRRRRAGARAHPAALALALLVAAGGAAGVLFTGSGLLAIGPGLVRQQRMLGEPAPPVSYTRVEDGAAATLAEHRGEVVLVNVWATWCAPCRFEMPELDRLQRDLRDRGLVVLHLSDEDADTLASYLAEHPTSATHGRVDPLPFPETGRPTTYLVDREGVIREILLGNRSYEQFEELVGRAL